MPMPSAAQEEEEQGLAGTRRTGDADGQWSARGGRLGGATAAAGAGCSGCCARCADSAHPRQCAHERLLLLLLLLLLPAFVAACLHHASCCRWCCRSTAVCIVASRPSRQAKARAAFL